MMSDIEAQYVKQIRGGAFSWLEWGMDSYHYLLIPQPSGRHKDLGLKIFLQSGARKVNYSISYYQLMTKLELQPTFIWS